MRDYEKELKNRIDFIKEVLKRSGATGIAFGSSGGKDSALVGILCKLACNNTLGVIMPCMSKRNYEQDLLDAKELSEQFNIDTITTDLSRLKTVAIEEISKQTTLNDSASANIAPRLRMMTLYAIAASENRLVAGTGNRSELFMGYFTKWGDGACDFNPISDLTVTEIYEFLTFLHAPESIILKPPSAGLFDGQTDENEMGISYAAIDEYILNGNVSKEDKKIIEKYHNNSEHKRRSGLLY